MTNLNLPLLPHIDAVDPVSSADEACIRELRRVLQQHGKESRFGVMLLHEHFAVASDEVLLERCDEENRVLMITPVKTESLKSGPVLETNWRLDVPGPLMYCSQVCQSESDKDGNDSHNALHDVS